MRRERKNAEIRKPEILRHYYQVIIDEGFENTSIDKIAKRMGIHPSLIFHYFKTKENATVELVDFIFQDNEKATLEHIEQIADPEQRFNEFINTIFGKSWSESVNTVAFYACFYLGLRNKRINEKLQISFNRFRDFIRRELNIYKKAGLIAVKDIDKAADIILTLEEGFDHVMNIAPGNKTFEESSKIIKEVALTLLKANKKIIK
jgi:AcrR family transcriptional regulator